MLLLEQSFQSLQERFRHGQASVEEAHLEIDNFMIRRVALLLQRPRRLKGDLRPHWREEM